MRFALALVFVVIASACAAQSGEDVVGPNAPVTALESNELGSEAAAEFPDLVLLDGHQAMEQAQGEPHILWFWGAL